MTVAVRRVGRALAMVRQAVDLGLMLMRRHLSGSGRCRQIVSLLRSALSPFNTATITKGNFIAAIDLGHHCPMPIVVIAALWLSIVIVLGILILWEYKRFVNKRRMRLPRDV